MTQNIHYQIEMGPCQFFTSFLIKHCIQSYLDIKQSGSNSSHFVKINSVLTISKESKNKQELLICWKMAEEYWLSLCTCSGCNREYETVSQVKPSQIPCCFCRNINTPTNQVSRQSTRKHIKITAIEGFQIKWIEHLNFSIYLLCLKIGTIIGIFTQPSLMI